MNKEIITRNLFWLEDNLFISWFSKEAIKETYKWKVYRQIMFDEFEFGNEESTMFSVKEKMLKDLKKFVELYTPTEEEFENDSDQEIEKVINHIVDIWNKDIGNQYVIDYSMLISIDFEKKVENQPQIMHRLVEGEKLMEIMK